jgi:hypothetical protein
VLDTKSYIKWKSPEDFTFDGLPTNLVSAETLRSGRDLWFCREHAVQYLFPYIDKVNGNTTEGILADFANDDMM